MSLIRIHRAHTLSTHRKNVEDAASIVGEQTLVLRMYSSLNPAENRCPTCYDEVYGNSATSSIQAHICPDCFGTTYEHGVQEIYFTKAVIGRGKNQDAMEGSKGQSTMTSHRCSVLWPAKLRRNDYIIRCFEWDVSSGRVIAPVTTQAYKIVSSPVTTVIKDGFNPTGMEDSRMGSSFDIVMQSEEHPLNKTTFPGLPRNLVMAATPFIYVPDWEQKPVPVGGLLVLGEETP